MPVPCVVPSVSLLASSVTLGAVGGAEVPLHRQVLSPQVEASGGGVTKGRLETINGSSGPLISCSTI